MSAIAPITATVGGKTLVLVRNSIAKYRFGTLGDAPVNDYAFAIRVAWASDTARNYATPEALAAALTDEEEAGLSASVAALLAPVDDQKKSSLMPGHLPESTSG